MIKKLVIITLSFIQFIGCANSSDIQHKLKIGTNSSRHFNNTKSIKSSFLYTDIEKKYSDYAINTQKLLGVQLVTRPIINKNYYILININGVMLKIHRKNKSLIWIHDLCIDKISFLRDYINGGIIEYNNKIYATFGSNYIDCIDNNDGKLLWRQKLQYITRGTPVIEDKKIYLQTQNNSLYSINAEDGTVLWHRIGINRVINTISSISPIIHKNKIVIQDSEGNIIFINKETGLEKFNINDDYISRKEVFSNNKHLIYYPIIIDNFLYFFTSQGDLNKMDIINKKFLWKMKINTNGIICINNNKIFVVDNYNQLLSINLQNGTVIWKVNLGDHINIDDKKKNRYWNSLIVNKHYVYLMSSRGEIMKFNTSKGSILSISYTKKSTYTY